MKTKIIIILLLSLSIAAAENDQLIKLEQEEMIKNIYPEMKNIIDESVKQQIDLVYANMPNSSVAVVAEIPGHNDDFGDLIKSYQETIDRQNELIKSLELKISLLESLLKGVSGE